MGSFKYKVVPKKQNRVVCIIRRVATVDLMAVKPSPMKYWATLRYAHIYSSKTPRDDMYNSPDYTFCVDTESVGSVGSVKELARDYAKKLGLRIARYDERL